MADVTLVSMDLENFKSFAGKHTIPLRPGFTTISGPNGSGKSNLLDAILFGLSLSGSRSLRAERLTDLISNHVRSRRARVELKFAVREDETTRIVRVGREVRETSSGYSSIYELNGEKTTRTALHEMLASWSVHPGGYNVIQQGDVTAIIKMSAVERRKIIDELAGTAEYDDRIDEAEEELEEAERHVENTDLVLGEIRERVETLADEREAALRHRELVGKKEELERTLLRHELDEAARRVAEVGEAIARRKETLRERREELAEAKRAKAEASGAVKEIEGRLRTLAEDDRMDRLGELEERKGEAARLEDRAARAEDEAARQRARVREIARSIERAGERRTGLTADLEEAEDRLDELEARRAELDADLEELRETADERTSALAGRMEEFRSLRQGVERARHRLDVLDEKRERHLEEASARRSEIDLLRRQIEGRREEVDELEETFHEAIDRSRDLEEAGKEASREVSRLMHEVDAARARVRSLKKAHRNAYEAFVEADSRSRNMGRSGGGGRAVRTVLQAGIEGVHGTVADLIEFSDEHGLAIESAAGGRLWNVVCDDDDVAARCVELLKREEAGRATFLPIAQLDVRSGRPSPVRGPGVIDHAIRLVDYDPAYEKIARHVLGTTLVVESLDDARRLIGSHRMVTLDGDRVERRGVITGGHAKRRTKSSPKEDLEELGRKVDRLAAELKETEATLEDRQAELEEARESMRALESDRKEAVRERDRTDRALAKAQSELEEDEARLAELEEAEAGSPLPGLEEEREKLAGFLAEKEDELARLSDEIGTADTDDLAREINSLEHKIHTLDQEIGNARSAKTMSEVERQAVDQKLDGLRTDRAEATQQAESEEARAAEAHEELETVREAIAAIREEVTELEKEHEALKAERDEAEETLETRRTAESKAESAVHRVEAKIESLVEEKVAREEARAEVEAEAAEEGVSPDDPVPEMGPEETRSRLGEVTAEIDGLGAVNMLAIEQWEELAERKERLEDRLETLRAEKEAILGRMADLEVRKLAAFNEAFETVRSSFEETYEELADGEGVLELEDPDDPFEGGLVIRARPRGKQIARLESMSGGEKSLTALAFVFAFQTYREAPFYALDEIDMFLDGSNTARLAEMIRRRAENGQFLVVSLRQAMLEESNRTIGVVGHRTGKTQVTGISLSDGPDDGEAGEEAA